ncbi:MAG: HupE/UreJ family protein [Rhodobacteraceae bacterium]|nr:HupE/UreJ family protein [Paracoccaceae bacterium]
MKPFALFLAVLALTPAAAFAHAGHDAGTLLAGARHPVSGADHILAMIAVGLWAARGEGRAHWSMPLAFVGAMVIGGAGGAEGLPFPAVEPMILASIVILGALVATVARLPLKAALPLIALFGAAHGWAHGAEGPSASLGAYALGFALVTAALHGAGIALGRILGDLALRLVGGATAMAGLALAVAG